MGVRMILGIVLIALGIVGLAYGGFTYTTRERAVDAGPIKVDVDKQHDVPIAPIVGALALAGGVALLLVNRKSS